MYGFAVLMSAIYLRNREWRILPLVLQGPLAWIGSSTIISGDVMTLFREWSQFADLVKYVAGSSLTHYTENLHTIFGFVRVIFFAAGVIFIALAKKSADFGIVYSLMAISVIVTTLAGTEALHWTGRVGDLRYIAVAGPFVGIVSAYGLSEMLERVRPLWVPRVLSVAVAGALVSNCEMTTHPRRWSDTDQMVIRLTHVLRTENPDVALFSNNYTAAYIMDVQPWGGAPFCETGFRDAYEVSGMCRSVGPVFVESAVPSNRTDTGEAAAGYHDGRVEEVRPSGGAVPSALQVCTPGGGPLERDGIGP